MKVIFLTDTHFGVRGDNSAFHENMRLFYEKVFFPYIDEHQIKKVIHLGDVYDNRKKIDMNTAAQAAQYFFYPLQDRSVEMDIIAGNHDLYFRQSSSVTALRELLDRFKNITFFTEPTKDGPFMYIPWINDENRDISVKAIEGAVKPILLGHFDIVGYRMYRSQISTHGFDPSIFKDFKHVYSGHYHHRHTIGNITYLGSPNQHTWADAGDSRGFHIFDTETFEIEFIENPYNMFETIKYPVSSIVKSSDISGKNIRILYDKIEKQSMFDEFVKSVESYNPANLTLISNNNVVIENSEQSEQIDVEDTETLINSVVSEPDVAQYIIKLYNTVSAQ